ncbi:MAG: T9SS type A sorting domain-containing protein [candidate division WOR-3 bacterium]
MKRILLLTFIFLFGFSLEISQKRKELLNRSQLRRRKLIERIKENRYQNFSQGEFIIDSTISYSTAANDQEFPEIAFDGNNYLVVWEDYRNGANLYGSRMTPDGITLDTVGIPISIAEGSQYYPAIVFGGNNYFVVWEDNRNGNWDIYGARITPEGVVLDPNGIPICTEENAQYSPAVAFDGNNYFVVWEDDFRNGIWGARINQEGILIDTNGIRISPVGEIIEEPSVIFGGENYLVVWSQEGDIYGARVTPEGIVLDPNSILISGARNWQSSPAVAFDGNNYFVVWEDWRHGNDGNIYGARVSQEGVVLDPNGVPISIITADQCYPKITYGGGYYFVAWEDYRYSWDGDIFGTRVTTNSNVLEPFGIAISTFPNTQWSVATAFDSNNYFIVWTDYQNGGISDIYGARVSFNGSLIDTNNILISLGINWQTYPAVSFDGNNYLALWTDFRGNYSDIIGRRISSTGIILDTNNIEISNAENLQLYPKAAFDGNNYLVVWQDYRSGFDWDIYGTRVSREGVVLEPNGIPIRSASSDQTSPDVAFDGNNYLVVWEEGMTGEIDIYGAKVTPNGVILDIIPICTEASFQFSPAIIFGGNYYFVAWTDYRNGEYSDIYGARITQTGILLDTFGIPIRLSASYKWNPKVAFDGTNYFVVWREYSYPSVSLYGARISQNGNVIEPNGFLIFSSEDYYWIEHSLAFDGRNYILLFNYQNDIYGIKISPEGRALDTFPAVLQRGKQDYSALIKGNDYQLLILYSGWVDSLNQREIFTERIWGKLTQYSQIKEDITYENKKIKTFLRITNNYLNINLSQKIEEIKIYDITGKMIKKIKVKPNENNINIPLSQIGTGIYFVNINKERWKIIVGK